MTYQKMFNKFSSVYVLQDFLNIYLFQKWRLTYCERKIYLSVVKKYIIFPQYNNGEFVIY